jgi:hypothetical protein
MRIEHEYTQMRINTIPRSREKMPVSITTSMLNDLISWPHHLRIDVFGDPADKNHTIS